MVRQAYQESIPYTFARVSAMKAKLIDKQDYFKLLKMDLTTLTRYLQESEYKDAITKLSTVYDGVDLVDHALTKNMVATFEKLRRISPASVNLVIDLYLSRWDFQNLKVVMRGIYSNAEKDEVAPLIESVGNFDNDHFMKLFDTGSVKDALFKSKIVSEKEIKDAYDGYKQSSRLIELENELDKISYHRQIIGVNLCGVHGEEFKKFLLRDIDFTNIRNLMRFKREGLDASEIMDYMIIQGDKMSKKTLEKLAKTDSLNSLLDMLKRSFYGKYITFDSSQPVSEIEIALQNQIIKASATKQQKNPMSIVSVLTYLMRKLIEVRNIRSIAKSKHLGIDMDFVENKLLIK